MILFFASTYSPYMIHGLSESSRFNHESWWLSRDSNPGPLGHEARILPLDYKALQKPSCPVDSASLSPSGQCSHDQIPDPEVPGSNPAWDEAIFCPVLFPSIVSRCGIIHIKLLGLVLGRGTVHRAAGLLECFVV